MSRESTHSSPPSDVQRCWDKCRLDEERILRTDTQALRDEFEDSLTFGPLLSSDSNVSSDRLVADGYRQLVRMLRNADSPEAKLRLLAMWLRQEKIMQPREFLAKKIRKTLIKSTLSAFERPKGRQLTGKPSELLYALVAEAWRPYFEMMRVAYEQLPTLRRSEPEPRLTKLGFDATAVDAALGSREALRTPIEAACRFTAGRLRVGDDTVLVAHSKLYPTRRRSG